MIEIIEAVKNGNQDKVRQLINKGENVNIFDIEGFTPLMYATVYCNLNIIKLLLKNGADINAQIKKGKLTPLMLASHEGNRNIVKTLIDFGADIHLKSKEGKTALMAAIEERNIEIVRLLINAGANINTTDKKGQTPLNYTVKNIILYPDIAKLLIKAGADVNARDRMGSTILSAAANYQEIELVKLAIKNGADVTLSDYNGNTPLTFARKTYNTELINLLENAKVKNIESYDEKSEGSCYIATMVYGSYSDPQVMVLRIFRDKVLKKSLIGKIFIWLYYFISPKFVKILKNKSRVHKVIKIVLDRLVYRIKRILY